MAKIVTKIKKILKILGPGLITGAADDDPTAIAAYTQAGAQFGYRQLWTALFTFPFMAVVQEMCARIGMVTGKGVARVMRSHYSRTLLFFLIFLLLISNVINIGADLGAMAASGQLILNIPFIFWLIGLTVFTLLMEIFVTYKTYARFLKYLTLFFFAYIGAAFLVTQDWRQIFHSTFVPYFSLTATYFLSLMALLGTNLSPYLFFWQADEEVEEEVAEHKLKEMGRGKPDIGRKDIRRMRQDTTVGMFFSNLIVFFICVTAAATLGRFNITDIETPAEAALALRPLAGHFASLLFVIGVIGSGLLAVPVLAGSASYALAEAFRWKEGLYLKFRQAHGFYGVITVATLIGLLINFTSVSPFRMLIYSAALNAVVAPFILILILMIANNKKIMGKFTNSRLSNVLGGLITAVMLAASLGLLWAFLI